MYRVLIRRFGMPDVEEYFPYYPWIILVSPHYLGCHMSFIGDMSEEDLVYKLKMRGITQIKRGEL